MLFARITGAATVSRQEDCFDFSGFQQVIETAQLWHLGRVNDYVGIVRSTYRIQDMEVVPRDSLCLSDVPNPARDIVEHASRQEIG